jgi:invasion protein IalB
VRRTLILFGVALAVTALAAFYFLIGAPAPAALFAMARGGPRIAPGFVGVAEFGRWRLICVPGPAPLDGLGASAAAAQPAQPAAAPASGNACRINREMPASGDSPAAASTTNVPAQVPGQVIVAVNFSLVGPRRTPSAMLRLPPTARAGDVITLRFDDSSMMKTMVRDCDANECLAAGTLTPDDWTHLSATNSLQLTFPALARQWVILNLPIEGLAAAIDALNSADASSVH